MNRVLWHIIFVSLLLLSEGRVEAQSSQLLSVTFYQQLALRWAPIHVQHVNKKGKDGLAGRADYVTAVDFDGDWDMNNNWDNLNNDSYPLKAHAYYSIVQTSTHWFINYAFFHPRDWCNIPIRKAFDTHENDLEGELTIIRRPKLASDTAFGEFLGMVTVFHSGFYPFSNVLAKNNQKVKSVEMWDVDGVLHPVTAQESMGHGLKAYPSVREKRHDCIYYYPSLAEAGEPLNTNDKKVSYKLVNIFEEGGLWEHRNDIQTFISPTGGFNGTYGGKYKAKPPWVWNSSLDGNTLAGGEHATNPVKLFLWYFDVQEECSDVYELNQYKEK